MRFLATFAKPIGKKKEIPLDPRYSLIKKILYDPDHPPKSLPEIPKKLMNESPVVVDESLPNLQKVDKIERAWYALKEQEAIDITSSLSKKYIKMRLAMLELEKLNPRLFQEAINNPIHKKHQDLTLFPARLRVPTETPCASFNQSPK